MLISQELDPDECRPHECRSLGATLIRTILKGAILEGAILKKTDTATDLSDFLTSEAPTSAGQS